MIQTVTSKSDGRSAPQLEARARVGEILKDARLKAGVSIDAVAHETKISKQFIVSLELGNFDELPGQVFGRGFIKNIARYLRSDAVELIRLYDESWADTKKAPVATVAAKSAAETPSALPVEATPTAKAVVTNRVHTSDIPDIKHLPSVEKKRSVKIPLPSWLVRSVMSQHVRLYVLGTVAAIMVLGVFGRWISAQMKRAPVQSAAITSPVAKRSAKTESAAKSTADMSAESALVATPESVIPSNVVEKVIDANGVKVDTPAATMDSSTSSTPVVAEESPLAVAGSPVAFEQMVEVKVSSPVEIKMVVDGKRTEKTSYAVGQTQLSFRDRAELTISDASAVDIIFNGKSLGSLGAKGRKRKIAFQAKPSESDFPQ